MNPITTREIAQSPLSPVEIDHALAIARHIVSHADKDDVRTIAAYGLMVAVGAPAGTQRTVAELRSTRLVNREGGERFKVAVQPFRFKQDKRDAFEDLIASAVHRLLVGGL